METGELGQKVAALVDHLRGEDPQELSLADVASITEILIRTMRSYIRSIDESLYAEVRILSQMITDTRGDIAQLRHEDMKSEHIPRAGMELEAIVKATEEATETIMNSAEEIMSQDYSEHEATGQLVTDACMRIFEACSFQDITGQRVTKVVKTLTYIEERLSNIKQDWDMEAYLDEAPQDVEDVEKALLLGPQLEGEGVDQTDVDAMFSSDEPLNGNAVKNADENGDGNADENGANGSCAPEDATITVAQTDKADSGGTAEAKQDDIDALFD